MAACGEHEHCREAVSKGQAPRQDAVWDKAGCHWKRLTGNVNTRAGIKKYYFRSPQFLSGGRHQIGKNHYLVMGILQQRHIQQDKNKVGAPPQVANPDGDTKQVLEGLYLSHIVIPYPLIAHNILAETQLNKTGSGAGNIIGPRRGKRVYQSEISCHRQFLLSFPSARYYHMRKKGGLLQRLHNARKNTHYHRQRVTPGNTGVNPQGPAAVTRIVTFPGAVLPGPVLFNRARNGVQCDFDGNIAPQVLTAA